MGELLKHYEALLRTLRKAGITCNPAKVHVAVRECVFYGFKLCRKGMSPAEKNLDPVKKMTAPSDKTGVRSILGVFNQFRSFFPRYARTVAPIVALTKKGVSIDWTPACEEAMQTIRKQLLSGKCYRAAPDPAKELCLDTDASDDGWGACLYQMEGGERRVIKMWGKQWGKSMLKAPGVLQGSCSMDARSGAVPSVCARIKIPLAHLHRSPTTHFRAKHQRKRAGVAVYLGPPIGHRLHHRVQKRSGEHACRRDLAISLPGADYAARRGCQRSHSGTLGRGASHNVSNWANMAIRAARDSSSKTYVGAVARRENVTRRSSGAKMGDQHGATKCGAH